MLSRARKPSNHLFDCFLEIVQPKSWGNSSHLISSNSPVKKSSSAEPDDPWVLQTYPTNYIEKHDQQLDLKAVPSFVYPCIGLEVNTVQNFSFVMTDAEAKWTYGFCRIAPNSETALVILSGLPWHDTFYKILNFVAELLNNSSSNGGNSNDEDGVWRFLEACRSGLPSAGRLPDPGTPFHISWASKDGTRHSDFTSSVPDPFGLPSIPENRNLSEYYNAVGVDTMLAIFAAMLHERRIMITSKKLYRLTACVQAANSLIYPMSWQHLYIPILPKHLVDYLSAPMPYLVGVPLPLFKRARPEEYGDAVVVDVDTNTISTPFHDEKELPLEVITNFKRSLRSHRDLLGDAVARAFLQAIVHLIGGYKDALTFREGQKRISFDESVFLTSRSAGVKPFLNNILELQIFRQFIEERLQMLNDGKGVTDEFEREAAIFAEKKSKGTLGSTRTSAGKAVHMGKRAGATIKREGADLARIVKNNSNVKEAVSKVKAGGKSAYKGVKSSIKSSGTHAPLKSRSNHGNNLAIEVNNEPHSAPASPTIGERRRPSASSTISGVGLTNKDGYSDFESYSVGSSGSSQSIKRYFNIILEGLINCSYYFPVISSLNFLINLGSDRLH